MRVLQGLLIPLATVLIGCAAGLGDGPSSGSTRLPALPRPVDAHLIRIHELDQGRPLFQSPAAAAWYVDGSLFVCDEKAGRVFGLDPSADRWFQFDQPGSRYFQPVDVRLEGFKVLVLDLDGRSLLRYTLGGAYQDQLVNFVHLDPGLERIPTAFDVDRDGRSVYCDASADQILLVDSAYGLEAVVGGHGVHDAQFREPAGIVWLPDGRFLVSDRANGRLCRYTGLGYPDGCTDRVLDPPSALLTPQGLDVDEDGTIFVADPAAGRVHVFDPDLHYLFSFGDDPDPGRALASPVDVAVGPDDRLAVCDPGRGAVLIFRLQRQ
jgi:sugar lactone lactonase YvrE